MSVKLSKSPVYFQEGSEFYNYSGIPINVAVVASPLVEEGSGSSIDHPLMTRKYAVQSVISAEIPIYIRDLDGVKDLLWIAPVGTKLHYGDKVIALKSVVAKSGFTVLERWNCLIPGKVIAKPSFVPNLKTNTLSVKLECIQIEQGSAEKFRGFGKYRGNGGFLKNITLAEGDQILFNPNEGIQFIERLVGGEEYKTLMYVLNILASKTKERVIVWNSESYNNEAEILELIEKEARRVTVKRWNIEPSAYQMFKDLYGTNPNYTWEDSTCSITHSNVWAWIGESIEIVEVPLTKVFMGKTRLFAEHVHYLGTEYPELYKVLSDDIEKNTLLLDKVLTMAEAVEEDVDLSKYAVMDVETHFIPGEKFSMALTQNEGLTVVDTVTIPEEYSLELLRKMARQLKKAGFEGIVIEAEDMKGQVFDFPVNFEVFLYVTGSVSHKAVRSLFQAFSCFENDLEDRNDAWTKELYRYGSLIAGAIEIAVAESRAIMAKGTKTSALAFTCRASSTIDASVGLNELHISTNMAKFWGIEEGDLVIPGRIPVPGASVLTLVLNDAVPYGVVMFNAATKHAIEEGDVDGDSCVLIVISPEGDLRKPKRGLSDVVPTLD